MRAEPFEVRFKKIPPEPLFGVVVERVWAKAAPLRATAPANKNSFIKISNQNSLATLPFIAYIRLEAIFAPFAYKLRSAEKSMLIPHLRLALLALASGLSLLLAGVAERNVLRQ